MGGLASRRVTKRLVTSRVRTFLAVALHGEGADPHRGEFVLFDVQNLRGARAQPPHPLSALFTA
jgi:hypothetical protein